MDKHFLEFWGNFLIHVAKGQKQLEDMTRWVHQGFSGFEDLTETFRKFYGLDRLTEGSPDYLKTLEKAQKAFQNSLKDDLSLLGVVPKEEHLALVKKYEELKEEVAAQEETIKHLRILLTEKGIDQGEVIIGFQELVKKQSDQFQKLMGGMAQFFQKSFPTAKE
jgi:hypothetical protein